MEKKRIYIVTETRLYSKSMFVETFIKGVSEGLEDAKSILNSLREIKIKLGFHEADFLVSNCGWTYRHVSGIVKAEIHSTDV